MRKPGRLLLQVLWLASLAACASARPVFDMRPVNDGLFNAAWPELLRTRYQCGDSVVGAALQAVRDGHAYPRKFPDPKDVGKLLCDMAAGMWPLRVRAFKSDSGIVEQWEFPTTGSLPEPGRPASSGNLYQTWPVTFEGPTPHLLRLTRLW